MCKIYIYILKNSARLTCQNWATCTSDPSWVELEQIESFVPLLILGGVNVSFPNTSRYATRKKVRKGPIPLPGFLKGANLIHKTVTGGKRLKTSHSGGKTETVPSRVSHCFPHSLCPMCKGPYFYVGVRKHFLRVCPSWLSSDSSSQGTLSHSAHQELHLQQRCKAID